MRHHRRAFVLAFAMAAALPLSAGPLPEFTVQTLDGQSVESAALARPGKWLLVYVAPRCEPCDRLLALWNDKTLPVTSVVVIVRGSPADAAGIRAGAPQLDGASWFVDPDGSAGRALEAGGAPVSIAYLASESKWALKGMLPVTRDLVSGWLTAGQ